MKQLRIDAYCNCQASKQDVKQHQNVLTTMKSCKRLATQPLPRNETTKDSCRPNRMDMKKQACFQKQHWIHPRNLTWNLKIMVSKWSLLFQGLIFRFHVKFRGCIKSGIQIHGKNSFHSSGPRQENSTWEFFRSQVFFVAPWKQKTCITMDLQDGFWDYSCCLKRGEITPAKLIWRGWNQIHVWLVGGWTNPFEKYLSNWIISPGIRGENKQIFETTTKRIYI